MLDNLVPVKLNRNNIYIPCDLIDAEGIYPYVYNMRVVVGMKVYGKDGNVYLAINEADPLLYDPVDAVSIFELA